MVIRIEDLRKLKAEGKISNEEFVQQIEENKRRLDKLLAESPVTLQTRKLIRVRVSAFYGSIRIPKRKPKPKEVNKADNEEKISRRYLGIKVATE
jgi:hypothetical protein